MDRCVVRLRLIDRNLEEDIDIPLDISAIDLIIGLNEAYELGYDLSRINNYSLSAEYPIALLKGTTRLEDLGVMNGTIINVRD